MTANLTPSSLLSGGEEDWPKREPADPNDSRKVKTAMCKDCGGLLMVSAFPLCENNKSSLQQYSRFLQDGATIDVLLLNDWNAKADSVSMCVGHTTPKEKK